MKNIVRKIYGFKDIVFKRLLGVSKKNFKFLLRIVEAGLAKRKKIKGRRFSLSSIDMLSLALSYLKGYETFLSLSEKYGISESTACRIQVLIENILIKSDLVRINSKKTYENSSELIVDATEIIIQRPKKNQKDWYSGKKKKHTAKVQIIIDAKTGEILKLNFSKGAVHDFNLFVGTKRKIHHLTKILADSGYQGIVTYFVNAQIPVKKTKNVPLTKEQKKSNRMLSKARILVENIIGDLKFFRILSGVYRNRRKRLSLRFNLIAAICNMELKK
jgi:IS5 family transposase